MGKKVKFLDSCAPCITVSSWGPGGAGSAGGCADRKLSLCLGQAYMRRDGALTEPLVASSSCPGGFLDPAHGWTYEADGRLWPAAAGQVTRHDLVSEYKPAGTLRLISDMNMGMGMGGGRGWETVTYLNNPGEVYLPFLVLEKRVKLKGPGAQEARESWRAEEDLRSCVSAVITELMTARSKFPPFNSAHEGWGILREEMLELEREFMRKQSDKERPEAIKREAVQVAAMALRLILDCCNKGSHGYGK
jgi:hypothetical protein